MLFWTHGQTRSDTFHSVDRFIRSVGFSSVFVSKNRFGSMLAVGKKNYSVKIKTRFPSKRLDWLIMVRFIQLKQPNFMLRCFWNYDACRLRIDERGPGFRKKQCWSWFYTRAEPETLLPALWTRFCGGLESCCSLIYWTDLASFLLVTVSRWLGCQRGCRENFELFVSALVPELASCQPFLMAHSDYRRGWTVAVQSIYGHHQNVETLVMRSRKEPWS